MQIFDLIESAEFQSVKFKKKNLFSSPRMFFDIYCLEPGQEQQVHRHAANDKIYLVLEGTVQVTLESEQQPLQKNQAAVASAGMAHGIANHSGNRAIVAVVMAPNQFENLKV
ncbi:MAG TPA: cupin domain-containing protein [Acidobacteriota bacterium]|jgi:mannose-6-phosphate isomerase-like protein (cupin superfamily)